MGTVERWFSKLCVSFAFFSWLSDRDLRVNRSRRGAFCFRGGRHGRLRFPFPEIILPTPPFPNVRHQECSEAFETNSFLPNFSQISYLRCSV